MPTMPVPVAPPAALLVSMATRADHAFGCDKAPDSPFQHGYTDDERRALLARVAAAYRAAVALGKPGKATGTVRLPSPPPETLLCAMARAYRDGFDGLPREPEPGWMSTEREQILLDMRRFVEEMTGAGFHRRGGRDIDTAWAHLCPEAAQGGSAS